MKFSEAIEFLIRKKNLTRAQTQSLMAEILAGGVDPAVIAGFLIALRAKGETVDELTGLAEAMRQVMFKVDPVAEVTVDTCGTGGDGKNTFNISTTSAFVVAGAGFSVAKHGNRSVSSLCGSADVLQALGVKVDMTPDDAEHCLELVGISFFLAPIYHAAMKHVAPVRKALGVRTAFNLLGPLVNPVSANVQVIGVAHADLLLTVAQVLQKLNKDRNFRAMVIHEAGYDEVALQGKVVALEVDRKKITRHIFTPKDFGLKKCDKDYLSGGTAQENAELLKEILTQTQHPLQDVVAANAALAIYCAQKLLMGKSNRYSLLDAVKLAKESMASGAALRKLNALAEQSH